MMSVKMMDEDIVCKSTAVSTMFFLSLKDHSTLGFSPNSEITLVCGLKFHWYLRSLSLILQEPGTKIEVFLSLPCWLSRLAFWNLKLKVLKYPKNCNNQRRFLISPIRASIWNVFYQILLPWSNNWPEFSRDIASIFKRWYYGK